jgi:phosphate transport system permease protein
MYTEANTYAHRRLKRRIFSDMAARHVMRALTLLSLFILLAMGVGLYMKSAPVIHTYSLRELLSGSDWNPMSGRFGFFPFILSSIYVTVLAVGIALPVSLLTALFLTENAPAWVRKLIFPVLDILAGIPSVVYGVWGTLIIVPFIADVLGPHFVSYTAGYSLLAGGVVLSVMIIPLLVSLLIEIFSTVPKDYRDAAASLGATRWQTSRLVVARKALPGIIAAVVLAVSKAFGETLAVLMVCGNVVEVPASVFDSCYPLPALIANNYGEMLSMPAYESALMFAALIMFVVILVFNTLSRMALRWVERSFSL